MSGAGAKTPRFICYVVSKLGVGGAEKNLLLLARDLPRTEFAPVVLSLNGEGAYAGFLRRAGVPVYSLGFPHPRFLWRLLQFFFRCSFDLFHGFMFHGNIASRVFAAIFRKPSISAIRVAEGEKRWHLWLDRKTSGLVDRYTVNSRALADFAMKQLSAPAEKISVIPNALSDEDRRPPGEVPAARRKLGIGDGAKLVAMVGRLHIQKDPETFLRAAKIVAAEEDAAEFLIAGIGPLKTELDRLIRELGLEGRFHLPGLVDARDVYAACDVFVLPSRWEGFPNAAIEAMAAGRPVVLADFAGASEVVDYGVTGMVFSRGDELGLAECVLLLLRDERRRAAMGSCARESALARYTVGRLVSENVSLYRQLTETPRAK